MRRHVPFAPAPDLSPRERLDRARTSFSGRIGWHAMRLEDGAQYSERADERFPTASVIKVALVATALDLVARGEADLDEIVSLPARGDRVTGGGVLKHLDVGALSLRDLCELAIVVSDNAATNAVFERVGGAARIAAFTSALGYRDTAMPGPVDFATITNDVDGGIGVSTARETADLLRRIAQREIAGSEALEGMLRRQHYQDQLPRWLGWNPYAQWHGREEDLLVGNKTGELDGIRADCGIVRRRGVGTLCLAIFTDGGSDRRETVDVEGSLVVAECAAAICADLLGLDC